MYYLVSLKHNYMASHLTRTAVYPVQWMGLMKMCCGMVGVSVRKMKALTAKMETVTITDNGG